MDWGRIDLDTRKYISLRIQKLCAEKGYNINSLARQSAVPPTTLKNIVHGGSKNPGIITLKLLCDGLGISLYDFFDSEEFRSTEQEDIE